MTGDLVVVLGVGPGLGAAVSRAFAADGARVVMLARSKDRLDHLASGIEAEMGQAVGRIAVDVTDEPALRAAFAAVRESHGDPTVLVHNPSVPYEAPPTRTPLPELLAGVQLATGSLLIAAQEVAPAMSAAGRGTILVTGNRAATTGSTWSAALAVQKAATRNLSLSLSSELSTQGIHVVTVSIDGVLGTPGFEPDRIAAEYLRLHYLPSTTWTPEVQWPSQPRG